MGYVFRVYLECADLSALWFAGRTARCFSYAILKQSGNKLPHSKDFAKTLNRYDMGKANAADTSDVRRLYVLRPTSVLFMDVGHRTLRTLSFG